MKIALVYPRLISQFKSNLFPLGLVYIATILKQNKYNVKIFDSSWDTNLNNLKKQISSFKPDVVGISATSDLIENAKEIFDYSKGLGSITILGGPHGTVMPKESFDFINSLDFVVFGEGEKTILNLLSRIKNKDFTQINGIAYKNKGKIYINSRKVPSDINSLPFPDRNLIPDYKKYLYSGILGITFFRGCPYNCKFCQPAERKISGGKFRSRSPENIVKEIEISYHKYGKKEIYVSNDLFTLNKAWIKDLYKELKKKKLLNKVNFIILSRVDLFDEELAQLLKKINVARILFGVESGSEKILNYLNKGINLKKIKKAFAIARKYKFKTHAFFILGTPLETEQTLNETKKLINQIKPTQVMFSLFTALPGTYFFEYFKKNNALNLKSPEQYDFYSFSKYGPNVKIKNLEYSELIAFKNRILKKRKKWTMMQNGIFLLRDLFKDGNVNKIVSRWKIYNRCKDFFG